MEWLCRPVHILLLRGRGGGLEGVAGTNFSLSGEVAGGEGWVEGGKKVKKIQVLRTLLEL